ncbi:MAG TPA: hypothetical protein VI792_09715 [Candidatus Eisenbacteria bacterium]
MPRFVRAPQTGPIIRTAGRVGIALAALLAASCASSNRLAQRSEDSLRAGQVSHAYEWARRALDKDPRNDKARADMTSAATVMSADWKQRVRNLAASDSLQAADTALDFGRFRAELARYQVVLPPDRAYHDDEFRILSAAANHNYLEGLAYLGQHQPKHAYLSFVEAGQYVPGFRDIAVRIPKTYDLALTRVAILPFANQTEVPGLSKTMADRMYGEIDDHINPRQFQFTRLIDNGDVYSKLTVSQLESIDRDQAIRIGRQLGVRRVVWGHYSGFTQNSGLGFYHQTVFHHVVDPDPSVKDRDRWEPSSFTAVTRQREVKVAYEFEIVDTRSGETLARHGDQARKVANTIFTTFQARGSCDDYTLLPPDARSSDPDRARQIDHEWEATFGNWTLSKVLFKAREGGNRTRYRPENRTEFLNASYVFPVFLDDLPSANDLAFMALDPTWKPVYDALQGLDDQDDAPAPAAESVGR